MTNLCGDEDLAPRHARRFDALADLLLVLVRPRAVEVSVHESSSTRARAESGSLSGEGRTELRFGNELSERACRYGPVSALECDLDGLLDFSRLALPGACVDKRGTRARKKAEGKKMSLLASRTCASEGSHGWIGGRGRTESDGRDGRSGVELERGNVGHGDDSGECWWVLRATGVMARWRRQR